MNSNDSDPAGFLVSVLAIPATFFSRGYALSVMWRWFVVPTFGLPPLRIPVALGIAGILSLCLVEIIHLMPESKEQRAAWEKAAINILTPWLTLAIYAIIHLF